MIRDVFYYGNKPNVHPREKFAFSIEDARNQCATEHFWIINEFCDYTNFDWDFDFEFLPDEDVWAEDHNNVWPSQHQKDSGTWLCSKKHSEIIIYRNDVETISRKNEINENWVSHDGFTPFNFDFSWHPDPTSPPYVYAFGTQLDENDGPIYKTNESDGSIVVRKLRQNLDGSDVVKVQTYTIETTLEDLVNQHPNEIFWALSKEIDYTNFDFSWRPLKVDVFWESNYVQVLGTPEDIKTHTYFVNSKKYLNGHVDFKFVNNSVIYDEKYRSNLFIKPMIFFIDHSNEKSLDNFKILKDKFGDRVEKTRFTTSWVDTISRCVNKCNTKLMWILDSRLDYSKFDFEYYPNAWQMNMIHVFGTQWSHWGTTFLVNKETFLEDTKYVKIIEHLSNLNFVKSNRANAIECLYDIVLIDHGNKETDDIKKHLMERTNRNVFIEAYEESYLKTFKNILKNRPVKKEHFVWICSSICDYSNFDFTYICDPFSKEQLHVFSSGTQKYGDTFLVNVNKFDTLDLTKLEDYSYINFNPHFKVKRIPEPIIVVEDDTHVNAAKQIKGFPYATLVTKDNVDVFTPTIEPMSLWSNKNIIVTTTGATKIIVPKEVSNTITNELYEWPHIKKIPKFGQSNLLDIVFLSNGEKCAEDNWRHLLSLNLPNRIVRVDGVNGRSAAYNAAVNASNTPWCFVVFAKLKVDRAFKWTWQPDRMQIPKHYIFYASNPVNGLVYGHQGLIAYNKKLTLSTIQIQKLDFTLSSPHEVVPMLSGSAMFNTDPWSTWKTSFRETLKLFHYKETNNNEETEMRLDTWLNVASGEYSDWCIRGSQDAKEYYLNVGGDYDKLFESFEWKWLKEFFENKYGK